jgi:hypothetical protein
MTPGVICTVRVSGFLRDPRYIGADRLHRLAEISDDLIVGSQRWNRRDHYAGRARLHDAACERTHGRKAGRRDAHDDAGTRGPLDHAAGDIERFLGLELRRLSHDAEHRDSGAAGLQIKVRHPLDRDRIDAAIVMEGRRRDRKRSRRAGRKLHVVSCCSWCGLI